MTNSNAYALTIVGAKWKPITLVELRVFLGLVIMMGLYVYPAVRDYWKVDRRLAPVDNMSFDRFMDIKRYIHLSPPVRVVDEVGATGFMGAAAIEESIFTSFSSSS